MMLRSRLTFAIVLVFLGTVLLAQPFERAPLASKKVKEIIEWKDKGENQPAEKIGHSFFDRQGRLVEYRGGRDAQDRQTQLYDRQGRIVEVRTNNTDLNQVTFYAYPKDAKVMHTTYRKKHYKTYWYYKQSKLIEEKTFAKGEELGDRFELKERRLYLYDKRDSLQSEVHYIHPISGRETVLQRKVLHEYHPQTGKRKQSSHYNTDGEIRKQVIYSYGTKGRLSIMVENYKDGRPPRILSYKYKNNKLWQRIDDYGYEKTVQVYQDGRLIRTRSYVGKALFSLVDYQYKYY